MDQRERMKVKSDDSFCVQPAFYILLGMNFLRIVCLISSSFGYQVIEHTRKKRKLQSRKARKRGTGTRLATKVEVPRRRIMFKATPDRLTKKKRDSREKRQHWQETSPQEGQRTSSDE